MPCQQLFLAESALCFALAVRAKECPQRGQLRALALFTNMSHLIGLNRIKIGLMDLAIDNRGQRVAPVKRVQDLVVVIDSLHVQNSAGAQSEVAGLRGCDGLERSTIGCEERRPARKNACKRSGSPWCCRGARSAP